MSEEARPLRVETAGAIARVIVDHPPMNLLGAPLMGALFELVERDYRLTILPGYLSYRRLRELDERFASEVRVSIEREGSREIRLASIGALYRDTRGPASGRAAALCSSRAAGGASASRRAAHAASVAEAAFRALGSQQRPVQLAPPSVPRERLEGLCGD